MNAQFEIILGVAMFTTVILALVAFILVARSKLVSSGNVNIEINGEKTITVPAGDKLYYKRYQRLGYSSPLPAVVVEVAHNVSVSLTMAVAQCYLQKKAILRAGKLLRDGDLSCQTPVKQDMKVQVPEEVFGVKRWECVVESNPNVATFIKELTLKLPEGEDVAFRAGGYVQLECPPHHIKYADFDIEPEYRGDWEHFQIL